MNQTSKILFGVSAIAITTALLLSSNKAFGNSSFINIYGGSEFLKNEVRGLRNNNPGNIRLTNIPWKGKIPNNLNTDGKFEQFTSYSYGVRALYILIKTYYNKYNLKSVSAIISKFAPPHENRTQSYINKVSVELGVKPTRDFILTANKIITLIYAIDKIENGKQTITKNHINKAMKLI